MSNYESAPATKMLATNCIICTRPLLDSVSVEAGIGPTCREKHGYNIECDPAQRQAANAIIHMLATDEPAPARISQACSALVELGFSRLAGIIAERNSAVSITESADRLTVVFAYSPDALLAIRCVPGRRFDALTKTWSVPSASRLQLWSALKSVFAGCLGVGPKGAFVI